MAAQRNLFNRLLGVLHHCLKNRHTYDETIAFSTNRDTPAAHAV